MSTARLALPTTSFTQELVAGGVKAIKVANRRNDAMTWLDPNKLKVLPGFNVRARTEEYLAHVRAIADSMLVDGFHIDQPVSVYVAREGDEDIIYLTAGHTRLEAALLAISEGASFTEIPAVILPKSINMVDLTVDLHRGNTSRPLAPYEVAVVAKRLERMGLIEAEIARRLVLQPSYVNGLLILAGAPRAIAEMVVTGVLSASTAIEQLRKHGSKAVGILAAAKANAERCGKQRITPTHLPGAVYKKAVRAQAPALMDAARSLQADPAYPSLAPGVRERIETILVAVGEADLVGAAL